MECDEGVDHGAHGDDGEEGGGDAADAIAEVQEADGKTTQDDGEVKPREKGSLIGEEDFGLDTGGEGNSLAYACQHAWSMEALLNLPGAVWRRGWLDMVITQFLFVGSQRTKILKSNAGRKSVAYELIDVVNPFRV